MPRTHAVAAAWRVVAVMWCFHDSRELNNVFTGRWSEGLQAGESGGGEFLFFAPGGIEIRRIAPGFERGFDSRRVAVDHRVPGRVAVALLDDHVLTEDAFEGEAKPG